LALSVTLPPRPTATLHPFGANVGIGGERLVRAVLCSVVVFFATRPAALLALLLGFLDYNNVFFFLLLHFLDYFEFWTSTSVVPRLSAVSALSHGLPIPQLWLSIVQYTRLIPT
jgi:hypothetical protein